MIQIEKVLNPSPLFRHFQPTEEKLKIIAQKLMDEYLYISDEYRDYDIIWKILFSYFNNADGGELSLFYEIGKDGGFDGILGFTEIRPTWKASLMFKLWNTKVWGATFARESRQLIEMVMDGLKLVRLETSTPDPRILKMAKICGFSCEGMKELNFVWDKHFYDEYFMAIIKPR
jgi:RimJ/RimL family protein N-acetyltransferase